MGRHRILNPSTNRKVFKTGVIGRKVQKQRKLTKKVVASLANKPGPNKPKPKTSETTSEYIKLFTLEQFRSLATLLGLSSHGKKEALFTRITTNNGGSMLLGTLLKKKSDLATKPDAAKPKPDAAKPKPGAAKPKPDAAKPGAAKPGAAKPKPGAAKPGVTKPTVTKPKPKPDIKKSYHGPGATKRPSPFWKPTKTGGKRPSARAMYDCGYTGTISYGDKNYVMAFRNNGSPYWKPC